MVRTLLVEDNAVLRGLIREMLRFRFPSMMIFEAGDGREAFQVIEERPPDLVLMDIRLPDENGLSLTRRIKHRHPRTAIIILTSYDFPEYREAASREGALHFVTKGDAGADKLAEMIQSAFPDVSHPM